MSYIFFWGTILNKEEEMTRTKFKVFEFSLHKELAGRIARRTMNAINMRANDQETKNSYLINWLEKCENPGIKNRRKTMQISSCLLKFSVE